MTNREKYIQLCEQESLPLHAQAWWWEQSTVGKGWDAVLWENAAGEIEAAMPYRIGRRLSLRAMLMPTHMFYHYIYISPKAQADIYERVSRGLEDLCRKMHIGWLRLQGWYPPSLLEALHAQGFASYERVTYRIEDIPAPEEVSALFSENKRRQLHKAADLQLVQLDADTFYAFHKTCLKQQKKVIDYSAEWASALLPEAIRRGNGLLLAAQDKEGTLAAALFLAWDDRYAYYLLPMYLPQKKNSGAVAWLTAQALGIAHDKGLHFDFEGSMTPSIASSYQQFGGKPVTYHRIEKFYNPLLRIAVKLKERS